MASFLNYLDQIDRQESIKVFKENRKEVVKEEVKEEVKKNPKILSLKAEISSIEGANVVIEKIQDWISKQQPIKENIEIKKPFRIPPKKEIVSPLLEVKNRAVDILDGLPEDDAININESSIRNSINISKPEIYQEKQTFASVADHASALL